MISVNEFSLTRWISVFILIGVLSFLSFTTFPQQQEKLNGNWRNQQQSREVEFYQHGGKYYGKVVWTIDEGSKVKVGDVVFKDLTWVNNRFKGWAVTPKHGDVGCVIFFEGEGQLKISAAKGVMTKSVFWSRVK